MGEGEGGGEKSSESGFNHGSGKLFKKSIDERMAFHSILFNKIVLPS
jgi:hypothetical protein